MFFFILILELFTLLPIHAQFPHFDTLPQTRVVNEGEDVIFKCHATPHLELKYSWLFNENPVNISLRIQQAGSNLQVQNVRRGIDSGKYACIATNIVNGASSTSPGAHLYIKRTAALYVQLIHSDRYKVVLKCHVENFNRNDLPNFEWFCDHKQLKSSKNIILKDNLLIIRRPDVHNNGLYLCSGINSTQGPIKSKKGYSLKYSKTTIKHKPLRSNTTNIKSELVEKIYRIKRNQRDHKLPIATDISIIEGPSGKKVVQENNPIDLPCRADIPDHHIQRGSLQLLWHKDNKVLREIDLAIPLNKTDSKSEAPSLHYNDTRISINKHNGSLKFSHVINSDNGQYFCQINVQGYSPIISDTTDLEVIEQLRFLPQPTSKNLELGSVGKVHCKAQGTPAPKIKWTRDTILSDTELTFDDVNGTLIFKNVTFDHRGNYTCIAKNTQGEINATVSINVVVAPKFSYMPEGPIEIPEMGTASMHCQAIGDPKPTIQWDKDLKYLSENNTDDRFTFFKNGTLVIRDVHLEDEGRYGCTIGNSAGLKRVEVQFIVGITDDDDGFPITRAVLITMSAAFAYIILVVGLMIWCRFRRQAQKSRTNVDAKDNPESGDNTCKTAENDPCLPQQNNTQSDSKGKSDKIKGGKNKSETDKSDSSNLKDSRKSLNIDEQTLSRSDINELIKLGRGEFGDIFVGKIKASILSSSLKKFPDIEQQQSVESINTNKANAGTSGSEKHSSTSIDAIEEIKEEDLLEISSANDESKLVLVKAFSKTKDEISHQEFQRQMEMFHCVKHAGVVRFYGLCKEKEPLYMVLEHTDWGDLKQFLLATAGKVNTSNSNNSNSLPPLKTAQILAVAYQIALGMDAIYRAKYTHRDLATRNCIISSDFVVKISYAALSKDKYNREYFKHRNKSLPIRWMAPECIQDQDEYSIKSDIFAYGVVVWELFNQATKIPFEDLSNEDFLQQSQDGTLKWTCLENIPPSLHEIILSCWSENSKKRPSFSQLCTSLHQAMQNGCK